MTQRAAALFALETQKDFHVVTANVLALDILLTHGNLKQKDRFQRMNKQGKQVPGVQWTSLHGGSFTNLFISQSFSSPQPPKRGFLRGLFSNKSFIGKPPARPVMKALRTSAIPCTEDTKINPQSCVIFVFPSQWGDTHELQTLMHKIRGMTSKTQMLTIVSMGEMIENKSGLQCDTEIHWAHFQATMSRFNLTTARVKFRKIALDSDEICDVIEDSFHY